MKKRDNVKLLRGVYGSLLAVFLFIGWQGAQAEAGQGTASDVVAAYLESLASGDTQQLSALIDGAMKTRNRQLALDPEYYGEFLRKHYADVVMSVESITDKGEVVEARVRFDYPTSQSTTIVFVLSPVDGQWKITDEVF